MTIPGDFFATYIKILHKTELKKVNFDYYNIFNQSYNSCFWLVEIVVDSTFLYFRTVVWYKKK